MVFWYRVETQAVGAGDGERVVLVCEHDDVGHRVDPQGVVVGPENRTDVERKRSQVALGQDGLHKLERKRKRKRRKRKRRKRRMKRRRRKMFQWKWNQHGGASTATPLLFIYKVECILL